jgi:predicted helicase
MSFDKILNKYRKYSFSEKDKGDRFERLMQAYLLTDPKYAYRFKKVWLWNEFPGKSDLGGGDTGIDLVALTIDGDYWAIQCKCYQAGAIIDKPTVDTFLSTSSRKFKNEDLKTVGFTNRLWIDTTGRKWGSNAEEAIRNQHPPVTRLNLYELQQAPVDWHKLEEGIHGEKSRAAKKPVFPHIYDVRTLTHDYFKNNSRGKLIMACGTGKTIASLMIAEKETNGKGLILFLVPSISLLGQTLREWSAQAEEPINAICICSDSAVSQKKNKNEDSDSYSVVDLALPASTNVKEIINQFTRLKVNKKPGMTVVFSTYQSIEVISKAQKELQKTSKDNGVFDLIICDEAHRTTGVSLAGEEESAFVKVHDDKFLQGKKRIYMTATPRLYSDDTKSKAAQAEAVLCSMDDVDLYGQEIYRIGFGEAVGRDLLTDYKVLILTLSDKDVPPAVQKMIADKESEINADDASKLIGCINALSKQILGDEGIIKSSDPEPMRRAVAFCQTIATSKKITATFNTATEAYISSLPSEKKDQMVSVASKHIDGTMSAPERDELLGWLKTDTDENECRVLTNVRCLSEGVDVPSLDAVMFLSARNSQVDVVQSVGRVMRKSPGKKYGYIIIPVVVPANVEADKALDDNERYKVVWTVLNALRAHDDRFNATVNKIELNRNRPTQILVGRPEVSWEDGIPVMAEDQAGYGSNKNISEQLALQFEQLQHVVFARMVQKVGDRRYWEQWAKSVAEIAERQVERISRLIKEDKKHQKAFANFLSGLQKNINPSINEHEAVEMLSQHIITKPVFEALFEGYSFVKNNPISVSMQTMLDLLEDQAFDKDTETLQKFYDSVKMRASGIDNAEGKQRIIIELYDKFFKTAFPKMVERLGIVYTPVEVVDFIINSVSGILKKEFNRSLSDENIHILDPFTGTGTFITRLLQSGQIDKPALARKYESEIHANEIVLLAYYIAAVNIENAFHDIVGSKTFQEFNGICLTDTFQLGESLESDKLFSEMFPQNSARVAKQRKVPLTIIIGNPPYSANQENAGDDNQNLNYPLLDERINKTYIDASSKKVGKSKAYDSYKRAMRWASDRLKTKGIICFVSNGSFIDDNSMDGFRIDVVKEFSSIYVLNLRGNARTQGELRKKEAGNVFGGGSRTSIAISLLVKNDKKEEQPASLYYFDIGDYLNREEKLLSLKKYSSIDSGLIKWDKIIPNEHGDWTKKRNDLFFTLLPLAVDKKSKTGQMFYTYSMGVKTNRDAWVINFSTDYLTSKIKSMITFYNGEVKRFNNDPNSKKKDVEKFIDTNPKKIKWTEDLINDLSQNCTHRFNESAIRKIYRRPFCKEKIYYDKNFNWTHHLMPSFFPNEDSLNKVIYLTGSGTNTPFSAIMTDTLPDLQLISNGQCFPLFLYEKREKVVRGLFDGEDQNEFVRRDGVTDFILERAKKQYGKNVTKEDIFYYIYGILHQRDYVSTFENDLRKSLPRLPLVDDVRDFWKISKTGRALGELHMNYEKIPPLKTIKISGVGAGFYQVEKMKFFSKNRRDTIIFNSKITIENIPDSAYEYMVNGKSAIEWVMERYQISVHKESGIEDNPNAWCEEQGNPKYIFNLLLSIINLSVQTVELTNQLPRLNFH